MGVIQQGFNQALTGATFLLQQTPWWQGKAETHKELSDLKKLHKSLPTTATEATVQANSALADADAVSEDMVTEKQAQEEIDQAERLTNRYRAAQNEIQIKRAANPSLNKKFQRYEDRMNQRYGDASTSDEWDVSQAERKIEKAKQSLMELHDQYKKQGEQQEEFRNNLKISKEDADALRAYGIPEDKIKEARYN